MHSKSLKLIGAKGLGKKVFKEKKVYNGWFGVGLGSSYYSEENLMLYAEWASEYLQSFLFVVADDIERYNLMAFSDLTEVKALKEARQRGDQKFEMAEKIAARFPHQIEVKRWQELTISHEYQIIYNLLESDYDRLPQLKEHIDATLWANIRAKLDILRGQVGEDEFQKKFRTLVKYAIEELASIIYLAEYHIYPIKIGHKGERVYDNIIEKIYNRHYNHVYSKILPKNQRGFVYLQAEKEQKIKKTFE